MSNYIEVRSMEEVAYLLNVLFTNLNNLDRIYYDMFINPEPMDIELERYDETGTLTTVILPNRAKDKISTYSGNGNPNGKQIASPGALYIDISTASMYYKGSGSDAYGWVLVWSSANLVEGTDFLSPSGDGSQLTNLNAENIATGTLSVEHGGTGANSLIGIVKGNGTNPFTAAVDGVDYMGPNSFTGLIAFYPSASIPTGWLYCDGAAYSRTTYAELFAKIGTTYGAGNGSTTFNIPDLRGYFIRGWDGVRGFNTVQTGAVGTHTHTLSGTTGAGTPHTHTRGTMEITGSFSNGYAMSWSGSMSSTGAFSLSGSGVHSDSGFNGSGYKTVSFAASNSWSGATSSEQSHTHTLTGTTAANAEDQENCVINKALVPIIKY